MKLRRLKKIFLTEAECVGNNRIGFYKLILPIPSTDPFSRLAGEG